MGANQSSSASSGAAPPAAAKISYYELLEIDRSATDDEIKKAYRRKALQLHPDRNYGDVERTTALFAEIQTAYEVLSDPQERAWYDSHEAQILRGDTGGGDDGEHFDYEHNVKITTADEVVAMMGRFNSKVEFSDRPAGFFGALRELFEQLAREERAAGVWEDGEYGDFPSFGHKDDEYEDVVKSFYAVWGSFATRKTFAWRDKYRLSEAPDRRVRRLMEKENKKARDDAIREFNEAVRALVAFVRKRDPRYTPNTMSEADRQKALRNAAAEQAARARAANAAKVTAETVPEWAQVRERDEHEANLEDEEELKPEEHYECVACHKVFKSEKQWDAHEKSKKHQKAVFALQKKMRKENKNLNLDDDFGTSSGVITPVEVEVDEESERSLEELDDRDGDLEDERRRMENLDLNEEDEASEDDDNLTTNERAEQHHQQPPTHPTKPPSEPDSSSDEYAPRDTVEARLHNTSPPPPSAPHEDAASPPPQQPKLGKAAQKRAKRAAAAAAAAAAVGDEQLETKFKCAQCGEGYPSKTKLFGHLREEGHAAPVGGVGLAGGKGGGGGKKGGRGKR